MCAGWNITVLTRTTALTVHSAIRALFASAQKKELPKDLTSYDFLKTIAVTLMIVDHITAFFFPKILWLRVLGRLCVPIWFFLIGYAKSRDLGWRMWVGAAILIASDLAMGWYFFTMNILVTIILVRLIIDPVMKMLQKHAIIFWTGVVFFLILIPFTRLLFDYGTQGMLLALFGYLVKHSKELPKLQKQIHPYMILVLACFTGVQWLSFNFSVLQVMALFWGNAVVMLTLLHFRPETYPGVTNTLPSAFVRLIRFTGRRTLEIYVAHFLLIKLYVALVYPARFELFAWSWFP
jgi:hypothetical protein